jgi:hypothetical protein
MKTIKQITLGKTVITVFELEERATFLDVFKSLGIKDVKKHTLTEAQIDTLLEKANDGEDVGLRTDGWANLIPTKNADGSVSVAHAYWRGSGWHRDRYSLGSGRVWHREYRLVVSNSDALPLLPFDPSDFDSRLRKLEAIINPELLK